LGISCHQRLAFHRPAERLRHGGVEAGNEALDALLEMLLGGEVAAAEELADQDREPELDLVDPTGVLGRDVESDPVTGIAQERLACCDRLEDAGFSLLPEILLDTAKLRHQAGEAGAVEKTRTSTGFPPQAPQACASTIPPRPHIMGRGAV